MHFGTESAMCTFRLHDVEQPRQTCDLCVQAGPLTDDELHAAMIRPLRHGARLHALIDACQSCPSLNLRCTARPRRDGWSEWQVCSAHITLTVRAEVHAVSTTGPDEALHGTAYHNLVKMGSSPGRCVTYHACLP